MLLLCSTFFRPIFWGKLGLICLQAAAAGVDYFTVRGDGALTAAGNAAIAGIVTASAGLTVTSGGLSVTAGGLTVKAGGLSVTAGGLTVQAGGLLVSCVLFNSISWGRVPSLDFSSCCGNVRRLVGVLQFRRLPLAQGVLLRCTCSLRGRHMARVQSCYRCHQPRQRGADTTSLRYACDVSGAWAVWF